ncbi:hypothetical protein [Helicobacter pylori]|nr:hypothetical protein [Helicobacter pylori]
MLTQNHLRLTPTISNCDALLDPKLVRLAIGKQLKTQMKFFEISQID